MKKDELISLIIAWDAKSYISLEQNLDALSKETELQYFCTPEQIFSRKELVMRLSDDAKDLLRFVLDTPEDMIFFIIGKRGGISKERLIVFLRAIGWKAKKVEKIFKELHHFCRIY